MDQIQCLKGAVIVYVEAGRHYIHPPGEGTN